MTSGQDSRTEVSQALTCRAVRSPACKVVRLDDGAPPRLPLAPRGHGVSLALGTTSTWHKEKKPTALLFLPSPPSPDPFYPGKHRVEASEREEEEERNKKRAVGSQERERERESRMPTKLRSCTTALTLVIEYMNYSKSVVDALTLSWSSGKHSPALT